MHRRLAVLLSFLSWMPMALAETLRQPEPYRLAAKDWPCEQPYRPELPLGQSWTRPELLQDTTDWRTEPELRQLIESVTAFDSPTSGSMGRIEGFAQGLPTDSTVRDRQLATLYRGLLDEANFYRDIVLTSILQFVAQHRLATDLAAEAELAFQTAADDDEAGRKSAENRQFWAARTADQAQDEARFQCHRLAAIDARFARMAAAAEHGLSR
jgi:hypothetical protein